jgi:hypothetical protein
MTLPTGWKFYLQDKSTLAEKLKTSADLVFQYGRLAPVTKNMLVLPLSQKAKPMFYFQIGTIENELF